MWQKFSEGTRRIIFFAQEEAALLGENFVGTEHLLLGLTRETDTAAARILDRLGVSPRTVRVEIERQTARGKVRLGQEMQLTPRAKRAIDLAYEEAVTLRENTIGTEHLLLGLLREREGLAGRILARLGVEPERVRVEMVTLEEGRGESKSVDLQTVEEVRPPSPRSAADVDAPPPPVPPGAKALEDAARKAVLMALGEDLTPNDLTTDLTVPHCASSRAVAVVKEAGVIAGLEAARQSFLQVDPSVRFAPLVTDGARVEVGGQVFFAEGPSRSLLMAERTALNLLQRLSGVATAAARYAEAVQGTKATIVDTRKTTPGLRWLEKYAVRQGGGRNHRFNLSDGILIKDNHIVAAGGIRAAVERVKAEAPHTLRIEVEVTNDAEIDEALDAGADVLLLDNMTPDGLRAAVERIAGRALTEASGGITLDTVRAVAESGVDFISAGALTHSVRALDISLQFQTST